MARVSASECSACQRASEGSRVRQGAQPGLVDQEEVDVGAGGELAPAVPAHRHQCQSVPHMGREQPNDRTIHLLGPGPRQAGPASLRGGRSKVEGGQLPQEVVDRL